MSRSLNPTHTLLITSMVKAISHNHRTLQGLGVKEDVLSFLGKQTGWNHTTNRLLTRDYSGYTFLIDHLETGEPELCYYHPSSEGLIRVDQLPDHMGDIVLTRLNRLHLRYSNCCKIYGSLVWMSPKEDQNPAIAEVSRSVLRLVIDKVAGYFR